MTRKTCSTVHRDLPGRTMSTRQRRGFVLHEAAAAILIVAAVIAGAMQMLRLVGKQRQIASQRAVAVLEASNLLEDLSSRPWSEITKSAPLEVSPMARARLPDAKVDLRIEEDESDAKVRRLIVSIDWKITEGARSRPVRLVSWRWEPAEAGS